MIKTTPFEMVFIIRDNKMTTYRNEHPKPQFERKNWRNLNGKWQFEIDFGKTAKERKLFKNNIDLKETICVPFCPESKLSGIEYTDFMNSVIYKRSFEISRAELDGITRIHFGAVDYEAFVYINEQFAGSHKGGYVSFFIDISDFLVEGVNTVTVIAEDDTRNRMIPSGKQSPQYHSYGCFYTRTTGIWQTVWLEFLPKVHIEGVKFYPNITDCSVTIEANLCGVAVFSAEVSYNGKNMGTHTFSSQGGNVTFSIPLNEKHLWELGKGDLYDVVFTYGQDTVVSYFGLRQVRLAGRKFLLNEKCVFQRTVLDQGFYPDGIYTAPSDEALKNDIKLSMDMGFNGARLHEKVFEERFLYHCDKMGYMVWGEYPDWGLDHSYADSIYGILPEWIEEINRDFNHPSIIGWCPNNETWDNNKRKQYDPAIALIYDVTKALDNTRPCIDTSGNFHIKTDIFDVHDYEQAPELLATYYDKIEDGIIKDQTARMPTYIDRQSYDGIKPVFVSEYGGIGWNTVGEGWGYGNGPKTQEEFLSRLKGLTDILLSNKNIMGLCYTQLTDVEQEQNGLYTYHRKPKFDSRIISSIFKQPAAIEDEHN